MRMERLGALGNIYDGPHATPTRREQGAYFLNISSLESGRLNLSKSDHVDVGDFEIWTRRVKPQEDDLLFSYETRLGDAALMHGGVEACLGRRMALIRPDLSLVDPRYLLYVWLSPWFKSQIDRRAIRGATVDRISLNDLGDWEIPLCGLSEQRAIGEVLGALDDKIVANHSILILTSELLEARYRAVRKARHDVLFEDVAQIGGGATPSTKDPELWGQGIPWLTPTDVTGLDGLWIDRTERTISQAGLSSISSPLYPPGSIAMTSRATIGAFALLGEAMTVNQGFIVLKPKDPSMRLWLYCQLRDRVEELKSWANGATFLELPKKIFRRLPVELGSEADMSEFAEFATPLMERVHALQRENQRLAATRDELLPLLMSGKITVKDAEKTVEEVV